ncbi:metal ABC transporter solute-binding protein, Zn/Mn family [Puniceicoccus vermicola]|uniref:Zinc ABC transporter substrate-binding protein n=1 Tax=Puniceicoccus vermicola TaxID=388746 RepID=A0A7X1E2X7_9BACT|nr:zinc ABC transporter substrate-binding protein [Puniceicoccus vermicola]
MKNYWKKIAASLGGLLLAGSALFAAPDSYPYKAVTTVGMITDVVKNIAGDKAQVEGIIGEGIDPHLYKPTRKDVVAMSRADIVFYSGLMLEGKMADVLIRVARKGKPVYAVTEEILESEDYVMTDEADHYDPHVWMDVDGWIMATHVIAESLEEYDPENADFYAANAEAYIEKLEELDAYATEVIGSIPENQRYLVTAHDAFNYMGRAYGIEVKGIQGISTESEAGVRDIENLVDFLVDNQIPAVFVETSVSDKNVRALVEGAKARGHDLQIGGSLFSDAMGPEGSYEGTYIGMIDHNATTISRALGGEAPQGGMNGKLSNSR